VSALIGKFVVVRTFSAGVHMGTLLEHHEKEVTLVNARRLWKWAEANTLNEISLRGSSLTQGTRISEPVDRIILTEAIEIIPTTPEAQENLEKSRWL
jgi:hypothetical protein